MTVKKKRARKSTAKRARKSTAKRASKFIPPSALLFELTDEGRSALGGRTNEGRDNEGRSNG